MHVLRVDNLKVALRIVSGARLLSCIIYIITAKPCQELKLLEFHAIWDKGTFYRQIFYKVEWFYSRVYTEVFI